MHTSVYLYTHMYIQSYFFIISRIFERTKKKFFTARSERPATIWGPSNFIGALFLRCGSVGHLFYQCRNMFTLQKELQSETHQAGEGGGAWPQLFSVREREKKTTTFWGRKGNQVSAILYIIFHGMMLQFKRFLFLIVKQGTRILGEDFP